MATILNNYDDSYDLALELIEKGLSVVEDSYTKYELNKMKDEIQSKAKLL